MAVQDDGHNIVMVTTQNVALIICVLENLNTEMKTNLDLDGSFK